MLMEGVKGKINYWRMKQFTPEKRHSLILELPAALSMCWALVVHTSICTAPGDNNLEEKNKNRIVYMEYKR